MKKFVIASIIVSAFLMCFYFCSCNRDTSIYQMEKDAKEEAYKEVYKQALEDAKEHLHNSLDDISYYAEKDWGYCTEDALNIISRYADGESFPKEKIQKALWAIYSSYWDIRDAINNLDDIGK